MANRLCSRTSALNLARFGAARRPPVLASEAMQIVRNYSKSLLAYGCIVSAPAALADWGSFALCVHLAGVHYVAAAVVAFIAGTGVNALLSRRFGFQSRGRSLLQEVGLVYAASSLGFGVSTLTLMACVEWAALPALAGKVIGSAAAFLLNFGARQFFVFSAEPRWK